jgi:ketosteroid isomerase-like protein
MNPDFDINVAKTEFREGYNQGDVDRVLSCFSPEGFTDMTDDSPSYWGLEAREALRIRLAHLFAANQVTLMPVIIAFDFVAPDMAVSTGWHKITLRPKDGGEERRIKQRYVETWRKQADGSWKIELLMTNRERRPRLLEDLARHPEEAATPAKF